MPQRSSKILQNSLEVKGTSIRILYLQSSHCGAGEMNLTRNYKVEGLIPGLAPPYAVVVALKSKKKKNTKQNKTTTTTKKKTKKI